MPIEPCCASYSRTFVTIARSLLIPFLVHLRSGLTGVPYPIIRIYEDESGGASEHHKKLDQVAQVEISMPGEQCRWTPDIQDRHGPQPHNRMGAWNEGGEWSTLRSTCY